jgi:hypothetical protein
MRFSGAHLSSSPQLTSKSGTKTAIFPLFSVSLPNPQQFAIPYLTGLDFVSR